MKYLVAGGSGLVGQAVCRALASASHSVTVLSRNAGAGKITWQELEGAGARDRFDVVVNACGSRFLDPLVPWNDKTRDEIVSSRVGTATTLREFVESEPGVERLVQITGVGAYAYSQDNIYTEGSEVQRAPGDFFQNLVMDWEAAAASEKTAVLRTGVVLSRDGGAFKEQLLLYKLGLGAAMGQGSQWFPWIHIDDLARLIVHVSQTEPKVDLVNAVSPAAENTTAQQFTNSFKRALGRPTWFPPMNVPGFVARTMFGGSDRADFLLKGMRVQPEAALQSGFEFEFDTLDPAMQNLCQ